MDTPDARPLAMAERLQHRSGQDQGAPHARLTQTTVTTNDKPTRSPSGAPTPVRKRPPTRSRQNADTANTVETPTTSARSHHQHRHTEPITQEPAHPHS